MNGDALFEACPDGGEITFVDGDPKRSGGLPGMAYILLFGGNDVDDGRDDARVQWWGDAIDNDPNRHVRGRTGTLLHGLPTNGPNRLRVEESAKQDLQPMLDTGVATGVEVTAVIEGAKRFALIVEITTMNTSETFIFRENWRVEK